MAVFGIIADYSTSRLFNKFVQYPSEQPKVLPALSAFVIDHHWICFALPFIWFIWLIAILIYSEKKLFLGINFHTSFTLLAGFSMIAVFLIGGTAPFLELSAGSAH